MILFYLVSFFSELDLVKLVTELLVLGALSYSAQVLGIQSNPLTGTSLLRFIIIISPHQKRAFSTTGMMMDLPTIDRTLKMR